MDSTEYETAVCMVEAAQLARERRADLLERLAGCFTRREPAAQAGKYIDGLCDDLPRKNGWTLAERAGDMTPDKMQRHMVLATAALAICSVTAAATRQATNTLPPPPVDPLADPPADPGPIPLTVAEVKRLSNLLTRTIHDLPHHLRWAWWRSRHQACARWYRHRARLRRLLPRP